MGDIRVWDGKEELGWLTMVFIHILIFPLAQYFLGYLLPYLLPWVLWMGGVCVCQSLMWGSVCLIALGQVYTSAPLQINYAPWRHVNYVTRRHYHTIHVRGRIPPLVVRVVGCKGERLLLSGSHLVSKGKWRPWNELSRLSLGYLHKQKTGLESFAPSVGGWHCVAVVMTVLWW